VKIGVISDTHISDSSKKIPEDIANIFFNVDLIIHAGDLTNICITEELNSIAKTEAVRGNMDDDSNCLPIKKILDISNFKIGIIHGYGAPQDIRNRIKKEFPPVDVIIYGHTHTPYNKVEDGILFFNPGSPTDKRFSPYNSVGILEIQDRKITGEIIKL